MDSTLDLCDIQQFCGDKSFNRGKEIGFEDFVRLFVQGNAIFGLYPGTVGVYRVNVIIEKVIPSYAFCTCPAMQQWEGYCKHVAALLICWVESKEEFLRLTVWPNILQNKSKEELILLIEETAAKSIDMTHVLYEELFDQPLIHPGDLEHDEGW